MGGEVLGKPSEINATLLAMFAYGMPGHRSSSIGSLPKHRYGSVIQYMLIGKRGISVVLCRRGKAA